MPLRASSSYIVLFPTIVGWGWGGRWETVIYNDYEAEFENRRYKSSQISPTSSYLYMPGSYLLQLLATTILLFVSTELPIMDILYKWNYTVCALLYLASFTQQNVFQGSSMLEHVSVFHSFLQPNTVPLCGQTIFCLSIQQLSCFHFGDIVENAPGNTHGICFQFSSVYTWEWNSWILW